MGNDSLLITVKYMQEFSLDLYYMTDKNTLIYSI